MKIARVLSLALVVSVLPPRTARAALTDSEKAVVRTFIGKGTLDTAARVRALVARPDLAADEIAEPLRRGYTDAPFDEKHRRFTEALLFGQGSAASRNTLVPAVVEGLLARAASRMADVPLEATARVDKRAREAADEVLAVHAFVDSRVANAGNPGPDGHDPSAGIREDALKACAELYKAHLAAHERWLHAPGAVAPELLRIRAQAALALIDLGRGVASRHEVSGWLGLGGAARGLFERTGVLIESDMASEAQLTSAVQLLEGAPHATDGLGLWILAKASPMGLAARGRITRTGVALTDDLHPLPSDALWPADVVPEAPDATVAAIAQTVAELATARAFEGNPAVRERARGAAERAHGAGDAGYLALDVTRVPLEPSAGAAAVPTGGMVVAGAVRLLLLDGARALDLALIRAAAGRSEPLEQLDLALTVLAAGNAQARLGHTQSDGRVEAVRATDVKTDAGLVTAFSLLGKHYALATDADGAITATVDGTAPKVTLLASFRERTASGTSWQAAGVEYQRLSGDPHAAGLDDGRFVVEGGKAGFDAVATGTDVSDVEAKALIRPSGAGGTLLVRASSGEASYKGIGLVLETDAAQARLLAFDGTGKATELGDPIDIPNVPPDGYAVSLKIVGDKVTAKVGDKALSAKLVTEVAPGRVGVAARAQGKVDVRKLVIVTKGVR